MRQGRIMLVATALAVVGLTGPVATANAATLGYDHTYWSPDGLQLKFTASPGKADNLRVDWTQLSAPQPVGNSWYLSFSDGSDVITPASYNSVDNQATLTECVFTLLTATCPDSASQTEIHLGDGNDSATVDLAGRPFVYGFPRDIDVYGDDGNDTIQANDGVLESVACGAAGNDVAIVDSSDVVNADCEHVVVK